MREIERRAHRIVIEMPIVRRIRRAGTDGRREA
jgi:hypothetical protein